MGQAFLIMLREGLEAALIVSIVLAYLVTIGQRQLFGKIWLGTGGAVLMSVGVGAVIFIVAGEFTGRAEEIFEGTAMLAAVVVLTWMIIWMKRRARTIRRELQAEVDLAVQGGSAWTLSLLAFVAVGREGIESALFMFAAGTSSSPGQALVGGTLGLAAAVGLGYLMYTGSRRLNLRVFFNVTGVLLIFIAAGLLAHGLHELQEAGLVPVLVDQVWDVNHILNEKDGLGSFLKALFGYNGNPSLVEVVTYGLYLASAFWYYFRTPATPSPALAPQRD